MIRRGHPRLVCAMNYSLPKTVTIDGEEHAIRYDFRVILQILEMLNDPNLESADKAEALVYMFYVEPEKLRSPKDAVEACFDFIDQNNRNQKKSAKLIDWEQDFDYIISPVNRVLGRECRDIEYDDKNNTGGLHWWSFISAYMEIGSECLLSQIISIRDKQVRGKKLEKHEREWLNRNRDLVEFKHTYTEAENELIKQWTGGDTNG